MPTEHIVKPGDCLDSIAADYGFFPDTLWNHGDNSALKQKRKDPNVLAAGDKIVIPDKQLKEESKPAEQRHKFKRKGVPAKLRLRFLKPKDPPPPKDDPPSSSSSAADESSYEDVQEEQKPPETEPLANVPYVLEIDGKKTDGQTDGDGKVELAIPPRASKGKLTLKPGTPEERVVPLDLGGMDPVDTFTGARKRLNNLGYRCMPDKPEMSPDLKEALMRFQQDKQLEAKGELNQATQDKLKELHGC